jgi:uncharacterized membrane protein
MERIRVFKVLKVLTRIFIILGTIATILGLSLFIKSLINGFNTKFPSGDWNSVFFTVQGLLFVIMGYTNLKNRKYYIEWDDKELRFLLPDTKKVESVPFSEIISVNIKLFEIEITLKDSIRTLNLDNLEFEDLKKVKKKFEDLSLINN